MFLTGYESRVKYMLPIFFLLLLPTVLPYRPSFQIRKVEPSQILEIESEAKSGRRLFVTCNFGPTPSSWNGRGQIVIMNIHKAVQCNAMQCNGSFEQVSMPFKTYLMSWDRKFNDENLQYTFSCLLCKMQNVWQPFRHNWSATSLTKRLIKHFDCAESGL